MKYWIECCDCHEEIKVNCGSGKASEKKYNAIKDDFVCDDCRAKRQAEKEAQAQAEKLANGYTLVTMFYGDYKNDYEGKMNAKGEKVQKGEYHADDKTIDVLVPAGKLAYVSDDELALLNRDFVNFLAGETEEELAEKKAAIMARFEEEAEFEHLERGQRDAENDADNLVFEATEEKKTLKETKKTSKWHNLDINDCHVGYHAEKSVKISMPSRSDYPGYEFWHPRSLVKEFMDTTTVLSFPATWTFKLTANGGALAVELTADEFLAACSSRDWIRVDRQSELHTPIALEAVEAEAIEELIDND